MRIAKGIKSTLSELAAGIEDEEDSTYILVRKNERQKFEKEESSGFLYQSLFMKNINGLLFETSILTLEPGAKRQPVSSDGYEFLYVTKGSIEFLLGSEKIILSEEDAFYFDGRVPHVPINTSKEPVEYLVVYLIEQSKGE
jgi:quercetin dioxygenase-like cupin family protein